MQRINWGYVISALIVGAILGIAGTLYVTGQRITRLEEQVAQLKAAGPPTQSGERAGQLAEIPYDARALFNIIVVQQRQNVRESYGELRHECFTEADLQRFIDMKRPAKIAEDLKSDKSFLAVALALQRLTPPERQQILDQARKPLRPTWGELGRISREGQTESGQKAELLIAEAIITAAKQLVALPESELRHLYAQ